MVTEAKKPKGKAKGRPIGNTNAEKPVSLWGIPFTEALAALLQTRPMPKRNPKKRRKTKEELD